MCDRRLWWFTLPAILVVGSVASASPLPLEWLARAIVYAPNTDKTIDPADDPKPEQLAKLGVSRHLRTAVGPPAASLSAWIIEPTKTPRTATGKPRGTILILHGVQDSKRSMLDLGGRIAAGGYRAVLVDLRGHGRSSGQWLTYGVIESHDLAQLLDALGKQGLVAGQVGALGVSYGGAIAIQWAGVDPRVRAVVAVAPYATMREEVRHYARHSVFDWFVSDADIDAAIQAAGKLAAFNPEDASPLRAITATEAQVLLVHGRADKKIPYEQSVALHRAAEGHSALLILENETHDSVSFDRSHVLAGHAGEWFDRWLARQ
jgi:pimeloyl-ACP methyl ester carboxylesterase